MKILVVTQWFWPEEFRINDICEGLMEKGHEIEVLTGLPNYPSGKIFKGYSIFNRGPKEYKGMKVIRVPLIPRGKSSSIMLILNYISFMLMASLKSLTLSKDYDKVITFQLSPITLTIPAIIISKLKKIPSYIYIQDLWPESFYSIVKISNKKVRNLMKKICMYIYNSFDKLLIASKGYENILIDDGINKNKIRYFPQWAEDYYSNYVGEEYNEKKEFIVTFAGNIGKAQSVDTIIKAANLAKDNKDIIWNIIGEGSDFQNITNLVKTYSLEENVKLLGRKPSQEMPRYFSISDALIVTLKNEYILNITLPGKVQSYLASGKPILGAISGEGNRVIRESKVGIAVEAEDFQGLYKSVITLKNMNEEQRKSFGENGKEYFKKFFNKNNLLVQLENILNE